MRIANLAGRLVLLGEAGALDVESASQGRFSSDPQAIYPRWRTFVRWASRAPVEDATPYEFTELGPPAPRPRQVFAVGLNYRDHAVEAGLAVPDSPSVFTKFASCLTGPTGEIALAGSAVDWEVELVAVIGAEARDVPAQDGWEFVAGVTVGQDLSERVVQMNGPAPQFSLGKSFPGFGPTGPWLVTPDELPDREDIALGCSLNGESVQKGRTSDLVFSVPELVARLSAVLTLLPGDLIFTGTPAGVGVARKQPRFLEPGDELISEIEGVGRMRHGFVASPARPVTPSTKES